MVGRDGDRDHVERLLEQASSGDQPFLTDAATLTLLAELAAEKPLSCVVDDPHPPPESPAGAGGRRG